MKLLNGLFFALLLLLAAACTPQDVCILLPGNNTPECLQDSAAVYWLHLDSNNVVLTTFRNLPLDFERYPQFGQAQTMAFGTYQAVWDSSNIRISNGNNFQATANAQMGMFLKKTSTGATMIAGTTESCDIQYVNADEGNWKIGDSTFQAAITIFTEVLHNDLDGSRVMRRDIETHPEVVRHKGTSVVLIDNFKTADKSCCSESCFACCSPSDVSRVPDPTSFEAEHIPNADNYNRQALFALGKTCISIQCEWLRITNCQNQTVQCFNTSICRSDLWLGNNGSAGAIYGEDCFLTSRARNSCNFGKNPSTDGENPLVTPTP